MTRDLYELIRLSRKNIDKITFSESEYYVKTLRGTSPDRDIWKLIENNPLDMASLNKIKEKGWKVEYDFRVKGGVCSFWEKIIKLPLIYSGIIGHCNNEVELVGYAHDITAFHEIEHVHCDLISKGILIDLNVKEPIRTQNQLIVEWLARKSRDNPFLLKRARNLFDLKCTGPYDYSSFWSHHIEDFERQESFQF